MQPTTISATFRKAVSDGNYGTEAAEVTISVQLDEGEPHMAIIAGALSQARAQVHTELNQSPSIAVRRALQRQDPAPARPHSADETPF